MQLNVAVIDDNQTDTKYVSGLVNLWAEFPNASWFSLPNRRIAEDKGISPKKLKCS